MLRFPDNYYYIGILGNKSHIRFVQFHNIYFGVINFQTEMNDGILMIMTKVIISHSKFELKFTFTFYYTVFKTSKKCEQYESVIF